MRVCADDCDGNATADGTHAADVAHPYTDANYHADAFTDRPT
jgi:hypothetical protein